MCIRDRTYNCERRPTMRACLCPITEDASTFRARHLGWTLVGESPGGREWIPTAGTGHGARPNQLVAVWASYQRVYSKSTMWADGSFVANLCIALRTRN